MVTKGEKEIKRENRKYMYVCVFVCAFIYVDMYLYIICIHMYSKKSYSEFLRVWKYFL